MDNNGAMGTYSATWESYSGTSFDTGNDTSGYGSLTRTADGSAARPEGANSP